MTAATGKTGKRKKAEKQPAPCEVMKPCPECGGRRMIVPREGQRERRIKAAHECWCKIGKRMEILRYVYTPRESDV